MKERKISKSNFATFGCILLYVIKNKMNLKKKLKENNCKKKTKKKHENFYKIKTKISNRID